MLDRLGRGGMGTVYRAEHLGLGQRRAIKFLRADLARRPSELRRFLQEARVVSRLHHPHVVDVLDVRRELDVVRRSLQGEALGEEPFTLEIE